MSNNDSHSNQSTRREALAQAGRLALAGLGLGGLLTQKGCSAFSDHVRDGQRDVRRTICGVDGSAGFPGFPVPLTSRWVNEVRAFANAANTEARSAGYAQPVFPEEFMNRLLALDQAVSAGTVYTMAPGAFKPNTRDGLELRLNPANAQVEWDYAQQIDALSQKFSARSTAELVTEMSATTPGPRGVITTHYRVASETTAIPLGEVAVQFVRRIYLPSIKTEIGNLIYAQLVADPNLMRQLWETFNPFSASNVAALRPDALAYARSMVEGKVVTAHEANPTGYAGGFCLGLNNGDHLLFREGAHRSSYENRDVIMTLIHKKADMTERSRLEVVANTYVTGQTRVRGSTPATDVMFNNGVAYVRLIENTISPTLGQVRTDTYLRIAQPTVEEFTTPIATTMNGYRDAYVAAHPAGAPSAPEVAAPNSATPAGGNKK